jgi:hypothetical protein
VARRQAKHEENPAHLRAEIDFLRDAVVRLNRDWPRPKIDLSGTRLYFSTYDRVWSAVTLLCHPRSIKRVSRRR